MNIKTGLYVGIVAVMVVLTGMMFQGGINADEVTTNNNTAASVQLLVTNNVGVPLNEGVVLQTTNDDGEITPVTSVDENGFYATALNPGTYQISASATGYVSETNEITVVAGEERQLVFYLDKE